MATVHDIKQLVPTMVVQVLKFHTTPPQKLLDALHHAMKKHRHVIDTHYAGFELCAHLRTNGHMDFNATKPTSEDHTTNTLKLIANSICDGWEAAMQRPKQWKLKYHLVMYQSDECRAMHHQIMEPEYTEEVVPSRPLITDLVESKTTPFEELFDTQQEAVDVMDRIFQDPMGYATQLNIWYPKFNGLIARAELRFNGDEIGIIHIPNASHFREIKDPI